LPDERGGELGRNFFPNLEAARPDRRPDRRFQRVRAAAEFGRRGFHGSTGNLRGRAAPTGVNGGDDPLAAIEQQNRNAIGGSDGGDFAGVRRNQSVGFLICRAARGTLIAIDRDQPVRMDLPQSPQPHPGGVDGLRGLRVIGAAARKVSRRWSGESVDQPRQIQPFRHTKYSGRVD
jgi:hypothetical protein